jgi:hypothetical protein
LKTPVSTAEIESLAKEVVMGLSVGTLESLDAGARLTTPAEMQAGEKLGAVS